MCTSRARRRVKTRSLVAAMTAAAACLSVAIPASSQPKPSEPLPAAARNKLRGGLVLAFGSHPGAGHARRSMAPTTRVPVIVELTSAATTDDVEALRRAGAVVDSRLVGPSTPAEHVLPVRATWSAVQAIAALARVRSVILDGSPVRAPRPLDGTAAEVTATDLWRTPDGAGLPVTGAGMVLCDIDTGVDVFHPMFFRPDAGYRPWIDVDEDGELTLGVDGVDLDGSGNVSVLRMLDGIITNYWDDVPLFGSDQAGLELGIDWLYADLDGDGRRSYGRGAGFDDSSPSFGEPLFVVDDVDRDGRLDPDEKLVGLGSSKLRAVRIDDEVYRRGDNLIDAPRDQDIDHGTGAGGVLVGGQRGLSTKVGLAPEADLIACSDRESYEGSYDHARFCVQEGARVVLHEYAPWLGYFLDGSSPLEQYIDSTTLTGVAHINPAGNLSGAKKLFKRPLASGASTSVSIVVPADSPYGRFQMLGVTLLWRDTSRPLEVTLEDPTGFSLAMPSTDGHIYEDWHDGTVVYAERSDSSRGTSKLDIYVASETETDPPVPAGTWLAHVTDPTATGGADLELIGYVADELSGWGEGIHFPEDWSEEHLVGHPGTADRGIAISAYTGHGTNGGTPGERAEYSGRGHRIDGVELLDVAAPDDPVTAGYREGSDGRYFVYGGTSGASPHVAAVSALLLQVHPDWTGVDVTEAIRAGALADDATGAVPNDDWGYGKLRAYRSLFGEEPPGGSAPTIETTLTELSRGETVTSTVEVADPDEPAEGLVVELDRDYDGTYDEELAGTSFEVTFDEVGHFVQKLRVTDSTGRSATALAHFDVSEPPPPPPGGSNAAGLQLTGGCLCATPVRGGSHPRRAWLPALALAGLALVRRSRRRSGA